LTDEEDYFLALATIARTISRHIVPGSEETPYVAGLWLYSFAQDILWNSNKIFGFNVLKPAK
jgi:hypothetical protein